MADEIQNGVMLYFPQKVQNLRLNGNVKRGCRLVRDNQLGIA